MSREISLDREVRLVKPAGASIIFVGDLHLHYANPRSRIDDYQDTVITKLENLFALCQEREVDTVILAGDVFHRPRQTLEFLMRVLRVLQLFRSNHISVFSIVGNHDLYYDRMDTLGRSSLGILYQTGFVVPLRYLNIKTDSGTLSIYGFNYTEALESVMDRDQVYPMGDHNICVAHQFYQFNLATDSITKEEAINLGYDSFVLGHDHEPYRPVVLAERSTIYRPGSFTRGTAHSYNMRREIEVLWMRYDQGEAIFETLPIPTMSADVVFTAASSEKNSTEVVYSDMATNLNELIGYMQDLGEEHKSVYSYLDAEEIVPEVRRCIEDYLTGAGIFRKGI